MKATEDSQGKTTAVAISLTALIGGVAAIAFFSLTAFYITAAAITVAAHLTAYIARRVRAPRRREAHRQSPAG